MLTLSAIVCTHNRGAWARAAVESLLAQQAPAGALDILLVDNASSDDTAELLADLVDRHPALRYVFEAEPGLSVARNRGIAETDGDIVAFLDDDAAACPGWAASYLGAFEDHVEMDAAGGRIDLAWPDSRPGWVPVELESMYTCLNLGDDTREMLLGSSQTPYGANMAVRRAALEEVGTFSTRLGRRGTDLTSGEERDLFDRLGRAGGRLLYVPGARVTHHVLPERARRGWLVRRAAAQGRSNVLITEASEAPRPRRYWAGRAGKQYLRALRRGSRAVLALLRRRDESRPVREAAAAAHAWGTARASARVAMTRRPTA